jgi:2-keto-3-deoxy-L-rhamnonate aldolase RhmA
MSSFRKRLLSGELCLGAWISTGSTEVVNVLRWLPFDWFVFDMEHSPIGIESVNAMIGMLSESRVAPIVRVGASDQALVKNVLDAGSQGVVVPLVNSREEAERAVRFSKYPPQGVRGTAFGRAARYGMDGAGYLRSANDENLVIVQVETIAALSHLDDIVSVEGVDAAFVGPSDLTMSLGLVDDRSNPRVVAAMEAVVQACRKHGKVAGVMAASEEEARKALERGFTFVSLGSDVRHLILGAREFLRAAGRS